MTALPAGSAATTLPSGSAVTTLPSGFRLVEDRSLRRFAGGRVLVGGAPLRILRLTETGRDQADELLAGEPVTPSTGRLARRLIDAGLAHPRPPELTAGMSVTTIIPVRDRPEQLDVCLGAIDPRPRGGSPVAIAEPGGIARLGTIVVDDCSRDVASIARVCRSHAATLLRLERPAGPGAARNAALLQATGDLVAFVDSDALPQPGWLDALSRHFADPAVGAAAPRIRPVTSHPRSVLERYADIRSPLDLGDREGPVTTRGRVQYVPTATLVVRREALGQRGFDPALRYGEDVDLVWRLIDAGWTVRYDPRIVVRHHEPSSWRKFLARRHRYGRSAAPLSKRHPGRVVHVVIAPMLVAAGVLPLLRARRAALVSVVAQALIVRHELSASGLPQREALSLTAAWSGRAFLALSRAAIMFAAPLLAAGLAAGRTRRAAAVLLLAAPMAEYVARSPQMTPAGWVAAWVADEFAYGTGVLRGCADANTAAPLRARWLWGAKVSAATGGREQRTPPRGGD